MKQFIINILSLFSTQMSIKWLENKGYIIIKKKD